jgi:hypothetical protein
MPENTRVEFVSHDWRRQYDLPLRDFNTLTAQAKALTKVRKIAEGLADPKYGEVDHEIAKELLEAIGKDES